jgi:hypothetical protein
MPLAAPNSMDVGKEIAMELRMFDPVKELLGGLG